MKEELTCNVSTRAKRGRKDQGKFRVCHLSAGHKGSHETIYMQATYKWPNNSKQK